MIMSFASIHLQLEPLKMPMKFNMKNCQKFDTTSLEATFLLLLLFITVMVIEFQYYYN